jgi:hypothetical protein
MFLSVAIRPKNEWFSNSLVVLGATLLAVWYQPALKDIFTAPIHHEEGAMNITHPWHRLFGIPILIAVFWSALLQWEDFKAWRKSKKNSEDNK